MATAEKFDVLVVGAGPAGIAAARAAMLGSRERASVCIVDDNHAPGGQIWRGGKPPAGDRKTAKALQEFHNLGMKRWYETEIVSAPRPGLLIAERDRRPLELYYEKLILATGARERFLPFPGWTLPNAVGAGGLQAILKAGLPVAGKRIVVAGSGPLLLAVAAYARQRGAIVPLVAEQAPWNRVAGFGLRLLWLNPTKLWQGAKYRRKVWNSRYMSGCWPTAAQGKDKVEAVTLRCGGRTWTEPCDILACGFGLVPNLELPVLLGCTIRDGAVVVDDNQESSVPGVFCAGEITGIGGAELASIEGTIAGLAATDERDDLLDDDRECAKTFAAAMNRTFALRPELRNLPDDDTFVCRCEDVTHGRLKNFSDGRAAKLQTRCGMGPCQGRVCGAATEFLYGWKQESVRPPILPATLETLATEVLEKQE